MVSLPANGPTATTIVAARPAAMTPATPARAIPDEDVIVGSPDITIVARQTLRFVRRVQPH